MAGSGRYALVTGGSRGIGFQICRILVEDGWTVASASQSAKSLAEAKAALPSIETIQVDVSDKEAVKGMADWVARTWGRLDVLINNAGVLLPDDDDLTSQADSTFEQTLAVNVLGPYLVTKMLLPSLLRSEDPRVINLGSTSGVLSPHLSGGYGVSKAALHALTIAQSNDLHGRVAVNAMSPGWVRTDMSPNAPGDPRTSAETALWLLSQDRGLTGKFVRDNNVVSWSPLDIVEEVAAQSRAISEAQSSE